MVSCSTINYESKEVRDRFLKFEADTDKAVVYVYRPSQFVGGMASMPVFDNGKFIANLKNHTFTAYKVDEGEHIIAAPAGVTNYSTKRRVREKFEKGKMYFIKAEMSTNMFTFSANYDLEQDQIEAKKAIGGAAANNPMEMSETIQP